MIDENEARQIIENEVKKAVQTMSKQYLEVIERQKSQVIEMKSMLYEAQDKLEKLERSSVVGQGGVRLSGRLDKEEFEKMLPHKLKTVSLEEAVQFEAAKKGQSADQYMRTAYEKARAKR